MVFTSLCLICDIKWRCSSWAENLDDYTCRCHRGQVIDWYTFKCIFSFMQGFYPKWLTNAELNISNLYKKAVTWESSNMRSAVIHTVASWLFKEIYATTGSLSKTIKLIYMYLYLNLKIGSCLNEMLIFDQRALLILDQIILLPIFYIKVLPLKYFFEKMTVDRMLFHWIIPKLFWSKIIVLFKNNITGLLF